MMGVPKDFLRELEASWQAISLLFAMLTPSKEGTGASPQHDSEGSGTAPDLKGLIEMLVKRLVLGTGAERARAYLRDTERVCFAEYPDRGGSASHALCWKEVFSPLELTLPVLARNDVVGYLQLLSSRHGTAFDTRHKQLLRAIVSFLGILMDRERLVHSHTSYLNYTAESHRLDSMLHKVWVLTEQHDTGLEEKCDGIIQIVAHQIPSCAGHVILWDEQVSSPYVSSSGLDSKALAKLQSIVRSNRRSAWRSGEVITRTYRRTKPGPGRKIGERKRMAPLTAVILVPLTRLESKCGILALGRDAENAEFTTIEKRALSVVSGLITDQV